MRPPHLPSIDARRTTRWVGLFLAAILTTSVCGCSLMILASKTFLGDPMIDSSFTQVTKVDLTKGVHRVLVVVTTPAAVKLQDPTVNNKLIEQISRSLRIHGVKTIQQNDVDNWLDDNGGYWESVDELANHFDTHFIVHVDLDRFDFDQARSREFIQGFVGGSVKGYEVRESEGAWKAHRVMNRGFEFHYPEDHPMLADKMSQSSFQSEFLSRITLRVTHMLCNHRASEEVQ